MIPTLLVPLAAYAALPQFVPLSRRAEDRGSDLILWGALFVWWIEELMFRGAIFRKWRVRWGPGKAALVSSLLFTVLHLQANAGLLVMGFAYVLAYTSARSLWAPVLLHALNNAGLYVLGGRYSWGIFRPRLDAPWRFVLLALVLLAGVGVWLRFVIQSWRTLGVPLPPDSLEPGPATSAARLPEPTRAGG